MIVYMLLIFNIEINLKTILFVDTESSWFLELLNALSCISASNLARSESSRLMCLSTYKYEKSYV
jgi:hypothetical protein